MRLAREGGFGGRGWGRVPACLEPGELLREVERLSIFHYGSIIALGILFQAQC